MTQPLPSQLPSTAGRSDQAYPQGFAPSQIRRDSIAYVAVPTFKQIDDTTPDPTLDRAALMDSGWLIEVPREQHRITAEVRARFAQALAPGQPLTQPALFGVSPQPATLTQLQPDPTPMATPSIERTAHKPPQVGAMRKEDTR